MKVRDVHSFFLNLLPYVLAILTICIGIFVEVKEVKFSAPSLSIEWGLVKDVIDIFIVLVFGWNGWIVLPPLAMALILKWRWLKLFALLIFLSMVMGISDTYISFDDPTLIRYAKGTVFYMLVFTIVTALGLFVNRLITKGGKCHQ